MKGVNKELYHLSPRDVLRTTVTECALCQCTGVCLPKIDLERSDHIWTEFHMTSAPNPLVRDWCVLMGSYEKNRPEEAADRIGRDFIELVMAAPLARSDDRAGKELLTNKALFRDHSLGALPRATESEDVPASFNISDFNPTFGISFTREGASRVERESEKPKQGS